MRLKSLFLAVAASAIVAAIYGCGSTGTTAPTPLSTPVYTPTPAPGLLYVDHYGTFYEYGLPLSPGEKPQRTLTEWPGLTVPPVVAADQYGNVALASTKELRIFDAPIVSFAASKARLRLTLTPAITQVGVSGADLIDMEYDPNEDLWLLNNLGADISMLRPPITKSSVAALSIAFGAPGSKAAGFTSLVQARFDVNAALYVYATNITLHSRLFKISFPYAKPPGALGLNLGEADFVDSSQWPPTARNAPSLLLGQYTGQLRSPPPGVPPSPPVDVTGQFPVPLNQNQRGLFPDAHLDTIVGALIADPYRYAFYTLDYDDGALDVYGLPMQTNAKPKLTLRCLAGDDCGAKPEHLFLAP
jgi:hypothetical protein